MGVTRVVWAAAVLWGAAVVPAGAATVKTNESCDKSLCSTYVYFTAAPGEANALTVTQDEASVTFIDGVPIHPGKGCTAIVGGARCATPTGAPLSGLDVKLFDRDDIAALDVSAGVYGGAGDDRITGAGFLSGGPGADELIATSRTDFADEDGARPAPDRYVGSPEEGDGVSYAGRKTSVDIDLHRSENAGDVFTSIERAEGGAGADRLVGTDGPDELAGGPGDDVLSGLGGDDELSGHAEASAPRARRNERDRLYGDGSVRALGLREGQRGGPH